MPMDAVLIAVALLTATVGTIGGLGGAILLVPALVLTGTSPAEAAPLGLVSVAAGSLAAAPRQLLERTVNHRLGLACELVASAAAVAGAILAGVLGEGFITWLLAAAALGAAVAGGRRTTIRNRPDHRIGRERIGERIGGLSGAYPLAGAVAPYRTRRLPGGLGLMAVAGFLAGTAGTSGGFIRTPALSEVMHVPTRVAAATTTFTVGITAATALVVLVVQGRIDAPAAAAVAVGSVVGGRLGARFGGRLDPVWLRRCLSAILVLVAVVLVVAQ